MINKEVKKIMKKVFQKQLNELGFMRCHHCGYFKPQFIDTYNTQNTFLGIPISKITKGFVLRCDGCHHEEMISEEKVHEYLQQTRHRLPYEQQLKVWKQIYTAHKYLSADDSISKELGPFFKVVKKEARSNIHFDVSKEDFDYIFNAYLTNLTKASKSQK